MAEQDHPAAPAKGRFFRDDDLNFTFLVALGCAAYGLADPGVLLAVAGEIEEGSAASAATAFGAAGERLAAAAEAAAGAGRRASAANGYQQAALLLFTSTYFLDAAGQGDRFAPT